MTLGAYIRNHRKKLGETQAQFAERIGVYVLTVGGWERDEREPNPYALKLLQREFGARDYREMLRMVYGG